mmetsp:Transcript_7962/g.22547  ORF Transcript_7962/g.22547 Transcript_7962/m.22547 type:complete len:223 (-) Transcript_7962:367-1035(-)
MHFHASWWSRARRSTTRSNSLSRSPPAAWRRPPAAAAPTWWAAPGLNSCKSSRRLWTRFSIRRPGRSCTASRRTSCGSRAAARPVPCGSCSSAPAATRRPAGACWSPSASTCRARPARQAATSSTCCAHSRRPCRARSGARAPCCTRSASRWSSRGCARASRRRPRKAWSTPSCLKWSSRLRHTWWRRWRTASLATPSSPGLVRRPLRPSRASACGAHWWRR